MGLSNVMCVHDCYAYSASVQCSMWSLLIHCIPPSIQYQMKMKQAQLRVMKSEEFSHLTTQDTTPLPPARSLQNATDLVPWSQHSEPSGPTANLYPCDKYIHIKDSTTCIGVCMATVILCL